MLGWKGIIVEDYPSEIWNKWPHVQCQELNSGRLAMMAIVGLVSQDLVTGDYCAVGKELTPIDYSYWEALPQMGTAVEASSFSL